MGGGGRGGIAGGWCAHPSGSSGLMCASLVIEASFLLPLGLILAGLTSKVTSANLS